MPVDALTAASNGFFQRGNSRPLIDIPAEMYLQWIRHYYTCKECSTTDPCLVALVMITEMKRIQKEIQNAKNSTH